MKSLDRWWHSRQREGGYSSSLVKSTLIDSNGIIFPFVWSLNFIYDSNVVLIIPYSSISLNVSICFYVRLLYTQSVQCESFHWKRAVCLHLHPPQNSQHLDRRNWVTAIFICLLLSTEPSYGSCSLLSFQWRKQRMSYCQATFLYSPDHI